MSNEVKDAKKEVKIDPAYQGYVFLGWASGLFELKSGEKRPYHNMYGGLLLAHGQSHNENVQGGSKVRVHPASQPVRVSAPFVGFGLLRKLHAGGRKDGLLPGAKVPLHQPPGSRLDPAPAAGDAEALRILLVSLPEAHAPLPLPVREEDGQVVPRSRLFPDLQTLRVEAGIMPCS